MALSVSSTARSTVAVYWACASSCRAWAKPTRCLHAAEVEQRKAHDRTEQHRDVPVRVSDSNAVRRVARARGQREARQVLRLRCTDRQRLRRELTLRGQHVGPATHDLARRADRHRVGKVRQSDRRHELGGDCLRRPPEQHARYDSAPSRSATRRSARRPA